MSTATSSEPLPGAASRPRTLPTLAAMMIRPRRTTQAILAAKPRERQTLLLVVLAIVSAMFGDFWVPGFQRALDAPDRLRVAAIVGTVVLAVAIASVGVFYLFALMVTITGKLLEGRGDAAAVRTALAWGLAPAIFALLYRVPLAFIGPSKSNAARWTVFSAKDTEWGWGAAVLIVLLDLLVLAWTIVGTSRALSAAHDFAPARGAMALLLACAAPVVVIVAAVLTAM